MKSRKKRHRPPRRRVQPENANGEWDGYIDPMEAGEQGLSYDPDRDFTTEPFLPTGNKSGYVFIVLGALMGLATLLAWKAGTLPWFLAILTLALPLFAIILGVKLVKGDSNDLK